MFKKVHKLLFGGVCLGTVILTHGGCASLVFDELSDMRPAGGGGSAGNGGGSVSNEGALVSGAKFGSSDDQVVLGAVVDTKGRIVMAGMTLGESIQDVGCGAAGKGGLDMFLTWVDPNDQTVQCPTSRLLGGMNSDVPFGIAADPNSGAIGIVGFFMSEFDCGTGGLTNQGGRDVVVARFVGDSCSWQQSFGDGKDQEGQAIAFDSASAVYIGGRFKGTLQFDTARTNLDDIGFDAFISKLSFVDGTSLWSAHAGGPGDQEVHEIAVHAEDIIVGGRFSESINFNGLPPEFTQTPESTQTPVNDDALFVASLDGKNACKWFVKIAEGPKGDSTPISLAVASDGDIFVAGGFRSRTLFPEHPQCKLVNETQEEDLFVAKLNLNGECQWSHRYGEVNPLVPGGQGATAITVDAASNVYVTGQFNGSISFGEKHEFQSLGYADGFVLKLNSAGDPVWSNVIAGAGIEYGSAIALDVSGEFVFVAGSFVDGSLNLGSGLLNPVGSDVFLAKFTR